MWVHGLGRLLLPTPRDGAGRAHDKVLVCAAVFERIDNLDSGGGRGDGLHGAHWGLHCGSSFDSAGVAEAQETRGEVLP